MKQYEAVIEENQDSVRIHTPYLRSQQAPPARLQNPQRHHLGEDQSAAQHLLPLLVRSYRKKLKDIVLAEKLMSGESNERDGLPYLSEGWIAKEEAIEVDLPF